jgi:hypothetical protein
MTDCHRVTAGVPCGIRRDGIGNERYRSVTGRVPSIISLDMIGNGSYQGQTAKMAAEPVAVLDRVTLLTRTKTPPPPEAHQCP